MSNSYIKLADPDVLPTVDGRAIAISPDGNYVAVATDLQDYAFQPPDVPYTKVSLLFYKRSGDTFTKLPDPDVLPPYWVTGLAFSSDGAYLAVGTESDPPLLIYKRSGDVFTVLSLDTTGLMNYLYPVFSPDGTYLVVAGEATSMYIFKRSGDTFTLLSSPDMPQSTFDAVFSPDGNYLAVACYGTPYILLYKHSGDTFTRLSNPDALPPDYTFGVAFSPDGNYVATASYSSPYVTIYKRGGDIFAKLPDPDVLPTGIARTVVFWRSAEGVDYIAVGHESTPYVTPYQRSGDMFTYVSDLLPTLHAGVVWDIALSSYGTYMALAQYWSPYLGIYKSSAVVPIVPIVHSFPWIGRFQMCKVKEGG